MSRSMKEQLVALGLVRPKRPGSGRRRGARAGREPSLEEAWGLRLQDEQHAARHEREARQAEQLRRQRINREIEALVDQHALNEAAAELQRHFLYKGRIRSVRVTPAQLRALNAGALGVVFLRGGYYLLEPAIVERVRAISPEHVPDLHAGGKEDDDVPEDLVW